MKNLSENNGLDPALFGNADQTDLDEALLLLARQVIENFKRGSVGVKLRVDLPNLDEWRLPFILMEALVSAATVPHIVSGALNGFQVLSNPASPNMHSLLDELLADGRPSSTAPTDEGGGLRKRIESADAAELREIAGELVSEKERLSDAFNFSLQRLIELTPARKLAICEQRSRAIRSTSSALMKQQRAKAIEQKWKLSP